MSTNALHGAPEVTFEGPTRMPLGDFELEMFSDGTYWLDGGAFFGYIPKVMWQRRMHPDDKNRLVAGLNSLLIRTGKQTILVDTGIGSKLDEKRQAIYGHQPRLIDNLRAGGVEPEQIDIVINTHLHFDHCGWNTHYKDGKPVPTFPRATYYAPRGEVEHGHKQLERDAVSYISDNYVPLIESGRMKLLDGDSPIVSGVETRIYRGHTAHMMAVLVTSGGKTACYISDLIPTTAHLDLTWGMGYDLFPLDTIESKKRFYAEALPEDWLVVFTHDARTPWCHVEKKGEGKYGVRAAGSR
jgi:glyoxylase-like metal-dependent hydrolase (beta-lactamase superfamily II)